MRSSDGATAETASSSIEPAPHVRGVGIVRAQRCSPSKSVVWSAAVVIVVIVTAVFGTAVSRLSPSLAEEVRRVAGLITRRWGSHGVTGFLLAAVFGALVAAMAVLNDQRAANALMNSCCAERASLAPWLGLLRLPGSLVAPSPMLPAWGSILQVVFVVGLAEAAVGPLRTSVVALLGHSVATAAARLFLWLGPTYPLGLAAGYRIALDTGPSAAIVTVAAYLAVILRCRLIGSGFVVGMIVASILLPGLAASEHLVALAVGLGVGTLHLVILHWRAQKTAVSSAGADLLSPAR